MIIALLVLSTCALGVNVRPIEDVVREFGYEIETHVVVTSDGYLLRVHRLLRGSHHQAAPSTDPAQSTTETSSSTSNYSSSHPRIDPSPGSSSDPPKSSSTAPSPIIFASRPPAASIDPSSNDGNDPSTSEPIDPQNDSTEVSSVLPTDHPPDAYVETSDSPDDLSDDAFRSVFPKTSDCPPPDSPLEVSPTKYSITSDASPVKYAKTVKNKPLAMEVDYGVPVLIVEGILQSSASNLAKGNGIAYSLVDQGFDVWLSNYRGNMYSRQHIELSPSQHEFWDFTLHEMGTKDLPALIDYVLEATRRQQLIYLGFSMGTTMFWILASSQGYQAYQAKVAAMVAVGPVARPAHAMIINNPVLRSILHFILNAMWRTNDWEIMPYGSGATKSINFICSQQTRNFCKVFIKNVNLLRQEEMEIENTFKVIPYSPAGISTKVLIHYIQIAKTQRFQQFDYGSKNEKIYGTESPPEYELKNIDLPIYFVYSEKDKIATKQDIEWLMDQFARRPVRKVETVNNFQHVDFSLNKDLDKLFTKPLTSLIAELADEHKASLARVDIDLSVKLKILLNEIDNDEEVLE